MTTEYAKLSLRCGMVFGAIDAEMHSNTFRRLGRLNSHSLTEELLETAKQTAIAQGVRPEVIDEAEQYAARLLGNLEMTGELQRLQKASNEGRVVQICDSAGKVYAVIEGEREQDRNARFHKRIVSVKRIPGTRAGNYLKLECSHEAQSFGPIENTNGVVLCQVCRDEALLRV